MCAAERQVRCAATSRYSTASRLGAGDRRQATEDRRQETGDRRQKTGDRRQKTGDRRQETPHPRLRRDFSPSMKHDWGEGGEARAEVHRWLRCRVGDDPARKNKQE